MKGAWTWIRRHWPELLLPPAVLLLAAGITRQALRTRDGLESANWRRHYQAAFQEGIKGDRARAIRELEAAARFAPDTPETQMDLALGWEKLGEKARSYTHLERALRGRLAADGTRAAYLGLVRAYVEMGRFDDAQRVLQTEVLPRWPDAADAYFNQGLIRFYRETGDAGLRRAASSFQHSLRLEPTHNGARYQLGVCLSRLGELEEAVSCFRRVLADDPVHSAACHALAEVQQRQGKRAEAHQLLARFRILDARQRRVSYLETRFALNRYRPTQLLEAGRIYLSLNRNSEALSALARYTREAPTQPDGHRQLAEAYRRLRRVKEARAEEQLARALAARK